jgi:hypothetical protein
MSSDADETVTVTSNLHGERTFRRTRSLTYRRQDGTETGVKAWQGTCVICGGPFEVTTPQGVTTAEQSKSFQTTTCQAHRLTPTEAMSLRFASPDLRRDIFATIKARKLGRVRTNSRVLTNIHPA